jgi:hypothetical protein
MRGAAAVRTRSTAPSSASFVQAWRGAARAAPRSRTLVPGPGKKIFPLNWARAAIRGFAPPPFENTAAVVAAGARA